VFDDRAPLLFVVGVIVVGKGGGIPELRLMLLLLLLVVLLLDPVEAGVVEVAVGLEVTAEKGLRKRGESGGVRSPAGRDALTPS
jgi:hypothetical protein